MKSFEERLERLEDLAESIRDQDVPLDEAMSMFEEGVKLSKDMEKELESMERKVDILTNAPDDQGEAKTEPFDLEED